MHLTQPTGERRVEGIVASEHKGISVSPGGCTCAVYANAWFWNLRQRSNSAWMLLNDSICCD